MVYCFIFCGIVFLYCLTLLFPTTTTTTTNTSSSPFLLVSYGARVSAVSAAVRSGSPSPVYAVPVGLYNEWAPNSHLFGNNQFTYEPSTSSSSTAKPPPSSDDVSLISFGQLVPFFVFVPSKTSADFSLLCSSTLLKKLALTLFNVWEIV